MKTNKVITEFMNIYHIIKENNGNLQFLDEDVRYGFTAIVDLIIKDNQPTSLDTIYNFDKIYESMKQQTHTNIGDEYIEKKYYTLIEKIRRETPDIKTEETDKRSGKTFI